MDIDKLVESFLSNTALIVDDEVFDKNTTISKIKDTLELKNVCFVSFNEIPDEKKWGSFRNIAFVIIDWRLQLKMDVPGVTAGDGYQKENEKSIVQFVHYLVDKYHMPIFVMSQESISHIKATLNEDDLIKSSMQNSRVVVRAKSGLSEDSIVEFLLGWYSTNPAVYIINELEQMIHDAKLNLSRDMYLSGYHWPSVVYKTMKKDDSIDLNFDFQNFLINAFIGRVGNVVFDSDILDKEYTFDHKTMIAIYGASKYCEHTDKKEQNQYTGDLYRFEENGRCEYLLNITAECDLRKRKPLLLSGLVIANPTFDPKFGLVEGNTSCYIPAIDGKICLEFKLSTYQKMSKLEQFDSLKLVNDGKEKTYTRVGRVLPPYINAIQNKFGSYVCRQGALKHPDEFFQH